MNSTPKQLANLCGPEALNPLNTDKEHQTERQREIRSMGGKASQEKAKQQKTIAEYMKMWLNSSLTKSDKEKLEQMGLGGVEEKKALLVLPLIKNLNKGDIKTYELIMKIIGEDTKREQEIEKLRLENELLKQELSGDGIDKVVINLDVEKVEKCN